jgi:hypothetical protein
MCDAISAETNFLINFNQNKSSGDQKVKKNCEEEWNTI